MTNRKIVLTGYAAGAPLRAEQFAMVERAAPEPGEGQLLLDVLHLSIDPYLRQLMTGLDLPYSPQIPLGAPIRSLGVARVIESRHPGFAAGDMVEGLVEWADRCVTAGEGSRSTGTGLRHLDRNIDTPEQALNELGLAGANAFFGVLAVARPKSAETMVVSAAAGSIGSLAGQIARLRGARVIGLAGSAEKRRLLTEELGFDAALDYRSPTLGDEITAIAPAGPDIYFDNVGGATSQAVMWTMHKPGRVIECGQIASYDDPNGGWNVNIWPIHMRQLRFESFMGAAYEEFYPAAIAQMAHWTRTGAIKPLGRTIHGLGNAPAALLGLYSGDSLGKTIVSL